MRPPLPRRHAAAVLSLALVTASCATAPTPTPVPPATPAPPSSSSSGAAPPVAFELMEWQTTVADNGDAVVSAHEIYRVLATDPGEAWSSVSAGWSPWQDDPPEVTAVVTRPDGAQVRLDPKTVVDQQEPREDGILTDGRVRTAPLPGLSAGALVETWVKLRHRAQFVPGWSSGVSLDNRLPVKKLRIVVDAPARAPLTWAVVGSAQKPVRSEKDGRVTLTFESAPAPSPPEVPVLAPRAAQRRAVARFSTVASWQAVAAAWAARAEAQLDDDAVAPLARSITQAAHTRDDKVKAIAAWVHKNVRYSGLELGENAWVPSTSAQVLERKFGDCKDLALLTVALLRAAGVDADVALVRSSGIDVSPETPGVMSFDHAIVRVAPAGAAAPELWLDATNPLTAYGEVTAALDGRRALVARADTTGLSTVTSHGASRLDVHTTMTFAEDGPARLERVRDSDGWLYSLTRDSAQENAEQYKKNLEAWAKDEHKSSEAPIIAAGDPWMSAPFHESLTLPTSVWGTTDGASADGLLIIDMLFNPIDDVLDLYGDGSLDKRKEDIELPMSAEGSVVDTFVPPPGFASVGLPDDIDEQHGPIHVGVHYAHKGEGIEATLALHEVPGRLTPDEAKALGALVDRIAGTHVTFKSAVFSALEQRRYVTAVNKAREIVRLSSASPSPSSSLSAARARSLVAYALASSGLVDAARTEAEAAVAAAPDDALVRDRAAFVHLYDRFGVELGRSFDRKRVLELCDGTLQKHPDDEWAMRLQILALARNELGDYLARGVDLPRLAQLAKTYREKTGSTSADDILLDALDLKGAWSEILALAPKLPQSEKRDAAWLAADVAGGDAQKALERAARESRLTDASVMKAAQVLSIAGAYDADARLTVALADRTHRADLVKPFVDVMRGIKPCAPGADPKKEPLLRMMRALVGDAAARADYHRAFSGADDDSYRDFVRGARGSAADASALWASQLICDLMDGASKVDVEPLPPYGELVTLSPVVPNLFAPMTELVEKTKDGYRIPVDVSARMALDGLAALDKGDAARAEQLFRAMRRVNDKDTSVQRAIELGEWTTTVPFWAAFVAVKEKPTRARAGAWVEAHAARATTAQQAGFVVDVVARAFPDDAKRRLAVGKALAASAVPEVRRTGLRLQAIALSRLGRFADARAIIAAELARTPDDPLWQDLDVDVAGALGEWARVRPGLVARAALADNARAATLLNNAAWYSVFDKVDDDARQQAERSVQLAARAANFDTLAMVDAELGRFDDAAAAYHQEQALFHFEVDDEPHPSWFYIRGRLEEAVGELDAARASYAKVKKPEVEAAADNVWRLAQRRLKGLASASPSSSE